MRNRLKERRARLRGIADLPAGNVANGQKLCEYRDVPFGWFRVAYNGCVALSVYNALVLLGYGIPFRRIHRLFHRFWKPRFLGVRTWELRRALKKLDIPFREFWSGELLSAAMEPGDVAIVMSWNETVPYCHFTLGEEPLSVLRFHTPFGGAHGVAVAYTAPGKWTVYNRYSNRDRAYVYGSFREFLPYEAAFMKGFLLRPISTEA